MAGGVNKGVLYYMTVLILFYGANIIAFAIGVGGGVWGGASIGWMLGTEVWSKALNLFIFI